MEELTRRTGSTRMPMTRGQGYQACVGWVEEYPRSWAWVVSVPAQRQVELIRNLVTLKVSKCVVSCPAGIFNINLMI